ncbi:hypothetical protein OESDEN_07267 [Oesophagostomum dentatum]|uniref:Uncharacterized protein n=1 Tax=Oesophagostomum dentatum TaxID=61180 RepID=A0A0B1TAJ2_OESDE|nr:hypothetical protein OESDEN_07267 [Oesophagostomum dentatum]
MECKMEPDEQILSDSPSMEDIVIFDSDECVDSRSEAVQTPPSLSMHTCQAGADLLKEMRILCQEQRQFFHEMTHMMREVCSLVQLSRAQMLEQAAVKSRSVRLKEIFQQESAEAVATPSLP